MIKVVMEFRKGVLFVRLHGLFNDEDSINTFNKEVKGVIINTGIKYVVLNINDLNEISKDAISEIKKLKKAINKMGGLFFLISQEFSELKNLVNLENELNVFERVVI